MKLEPLRDGYKKHTDVYDMMMNNYSTLEGSDRLHSLQELLMSAISSNMGKIVAAKTLGKGGAGDSMFR